MLLKTDAGHTEADVGDVVKPGDSVNLIGRCSNPQPQALTKENTDMNDPMTILKADHRDVKRLLTALAESEEGPERDRMAADVQKALTVHKELEERLVYPLVEREVGEEDAEEANIEHGLARDGLATMLVMVDKPGFGAPVEMVKGGIEHHVHEEESEIFPELKDKLDRTEWLALGDAIVQGKADAGLPVPSTRKPTKRSAKRRATAKN